MPAKVVELDEDRAAMVRRLRSIGVDLDYLLVEHKADDDPATHAAVAQAAHATTAPSHGWTPDDLPTDPPPATVGERLAVGDLFGANFDRARGELLVVPPAGVLVGLRPDDRPAIGWGPYVWTDRPDADHLVWWTPSDPRFGSYTTCFTWSPRADGASPASIAELFVEANEVLLGGPPDSAVAYQWPVEWGADDREARWGSGYVWTLRLDGTRFLAVCAWDDEA